MTKQQKKISSEHNHDEQRKEYCRKCIIEFQRLGYQDAFLEELKKDKTALLDKYPFTPTSPPDEWIQFAGDDFNLAG